jgi:peptidoglycan/LPS O-acetylase OafA/YrhL
MDKHTYDVLDGMRGVAAFAILTLHFNPEFGLAPWLPSAYLAVDFFFMLSGFVLAHAYDRRFESGMSATRFLSVRFIRLYPLYVLSVMIPVTGLCVAALARLKSSAALNSALCALSWNLLFLPTPDWQNGGPLFPLNGPAWSLFFELAVNLLWAIGWSHLARRELWLTVAIAALLLMFAGLGAGDLSGGFNWATFLFGGCRALFGFSTGVLVFRVFGNLSRSRLNPLLPVLGLVFVLWGPVPFGEWRTVYDLAAVMFVFPLLLIFGSRTRSVARTRKLCGFAGATSYAIYVLHEPVLGAIDRIAVRLTGNSIYLSGTVACLFACAVIVGLAWMAHRWFDEPVRKWLHVCLSRRERRGDAKVDPMTHRDLNERNVNL